ncbi:hypothetical protein PsYK624_102010 [Phanerochaete sordida]|uniref:Uncharacterized protein n=1 Tax=Phanerochaete sordida TaxID=48140 RepID=A0A9P3LGP6_9APHY|nr:hypothetical protein PsYK624_102010 [Phanerochaete sordida]
MPTTALLALLALALSSTALLVPRDAPAGCASPALVSTRTLAAGTAAVELATYACAGARTDGLGLSIGLSLGLGDPWPTPPPRARPTSSTSTAPAAAPTADVCGALCTNSCGSVGSLPPISEDCDEIFKAMSILGATSPGFTVEGGHAQQLTYGTCRVYFQNLSGETMSECYQALANAARTAGTQCFPPTQPVNSAGFCKAADGTWQIGIGHS